MGKRLKMNGEPTQEDLKIDINQAETMECDKCQGKLWDSAHIVKRVSPLISPTGQEILVPLPILVCKKCHYIPENLLRQAGIPVDEV